MSDTTKQLSDTTQQWEARAHNLSETVSKHYSWLAAISLAAIAAILRLFPSSTTFTTLCALPALLLSISLVCGGLVLFTLREYALEMVAFARLLPMFPNLKSLGKDKAVQDHALQIDKTDKTFDRRLKIQQATCISGIILLVVVAAVHALWPPSRRPAQVIHPPSYPASRGTPKAAEPYLVTWVIDGETFVV